MSESNSTTAAPTTTYRNSPRPPTSALWTLLRKDTLAPPSLSTVVPNPPIAPLDKTGTSIRILLHDTQVNFEQFSARVDKLYASVAEAKGEITMVKTLFQTEHETLVGEMVDLVNRCQSEIQRTLGYPAQAEKLEELHKNFDRRFEGLNLRIDAIQTFNQTNSQTLQTQSQMLQTLQEQQGTIITALMPLLPLLQAVPLHIESARNNINETFLKFPLASLNVPSSQTLARHNLKPTGKRSSSTIRSEGPSSSPLSTRKRPRLDTEVGEVPKRSTQSFQSNRDRLPLASLNPHTPRIQSHPYASHILNRRSTPQTSPKLPKNTRLSPFPTSSLNNRSTSFAFPNSKTPRRPLGHLFMSIQNQNPVSPAPADLRSQTSTAVSSQNLISVDGLSHNQSPLTFPSTPSARPPPNMLRVHTSLSDGTAAPVSSTVGPKFNNSSAGKKFPSQAIAPSPAPSIQYRDLNQEQALKHTSLQSGMATTTTAQTLDATAPCTRGAEMGPPTLTRPPPQHSSMQRPSDKLPSQHQHPTATVLRSPFPPPVNARAARSAQLKIVPLTISSAKQMNLRERRSPFREGRRFIPLGDDDDEEDSE